MIITKKRINSLSFLDNINIDNIQIGIQVTNNEEKIFGIDRFEEGIAIEPSYLLGINCKKNTFGFSYPDKTKKKENRVINTLEWSWKDYSGKEYSDFYDIVREVYPRIQVKAANIELVFTKNNISEQFIIAKMNHSEKEIYLKQTINMILELFGFCEIFTQNLDFIESKSNIKRCNWELLPPGIKVKFESKHDNNSNEKNTHKRKDFNQTRLDVLNSYKPSETFVGSGGFTGYFAYIFDNTCYLENAIYGNSTYIIPKKDWKRLSQLSKQDLLENNFIIEKINHTSEWFNKIKLLMNKLEAKSLD